MLPGSRDDEHAGVAETRLRRLEGVAEATGRRPQPVEPQQRVLDVEARQSARVRRFLAEREALAAAERRIAEARHDENAPRGSIVDITS